MKLDPNNEIFYQWLSGFSEGEIQILSTLFYELLLSLDPAFLFIMPAVTYCNPEIQKAQILNENKGKYGVYRWTNKESGKSYVGSAVDLSKRLCLYYNNYHLTKVNMVINKALKKHKHSNFTLGLCPWILWTIWCNFKRTTFYWSFKARKWCLICCWIIIRVQTFWKNQSHI